MTEKKAQPPQRRKKREKPKVHGDTDWLEARIKERGFSSERDLMRKMGMAPGALTRRKQGKTAWGVLEIDAFSIALNVSFYELARRFGYRISVPQTPVIGVIRPDSRVSFVTKQRDTTVPAISDDLTVRALLFEVDAGPLKGYSGDALHYKPGKHIVAEAFGHIGVIEIEGETSPVVGTLDRAPHGKLRVTLLGSNEVIEAPQVLSAAPSLGIVKT